MSRETLQERLGVPLEFHDGWVPLVEKLVDALDATGLPYGVGQVKEKFGGLRFYWHVPYEENEEPKDDEDISAVMHRYSEFERLIREAEIEALETCEICGAPGKMTGARWLRTACTEHALD